MFDPHSDRARRILSRLLARRPAEAATAPETLPGTPAPRVGAGRVRVFRYGPELLEEETVEGPPPGPLNPPGQGVIWVHVEGLRDEAIVEDLAARFSVHALVVEDVLQPGQRPKAEEFPSHLFLELHQLHPPADGRATLLPSQLSLLFGEGWVLSFEERVGPGLEAVRQRVRKAHGRLRERPADHLVWAILDTVVDGYFEVLERFAERAEAIEEEAVRDPSPETLARIHELRRQLMVIRRSIWPVRDVVQTLIRSDASFLHPETRPFLRDIHDHAVQAIETVEILHDLASGLMELHLSTVGNRTNEVMKVLTIMATLFIPLTFIVGIYGMNFRHMPELDSRWGYPAVWALMIGVVAGMLFWFRRKRWI